MSAPPDRQAESEAPPSRRERARLLAAAAQARATQLSERAQEERGHHASLDAVFEMADRDAEIGGGIIAGALAYRMFIWLLPFALILVAGLGFAADSASESPQKAAKSLGLAGLVSHSVASAASDSARWYALLVGIPVLVWATRSMLRVLIGAHRLVWTDLRASAPRPTAGASLRLLLLLLGFWALTGLTSAARAHSPWAGFVASLALIVPYGGFWLLVSLRIPHRGARWTALIPGALLFAVGVELFQLAVAYVITPWSLSRQGTYGALGIASALLFGLFLFSRLIVGTAVLNATLWERAARADDDARVEPPPRTFDEAGRL